MRKTKKQKKAWLKQRLIGASVAILAFALLLTSPGLTNANPSPTSIHYQGRMREKATGELYSGTIQTRFTITGSGQSWQTPGLRPDNGSTDIPVNNGLFNVEIPIDIAEVNFNEGPYSMEIEICESDCGTPGNWDSLGSAPILGVPYAINADMLDGFHWDDLPTLVGGNFIENRTGSPQTGSDFWIDGTGIIDGPLGVGGTITNHLDGETRVLVGEDLDVNGNIYLSGGDRFVGTEGNNILSLRTNNQDRITILGNGNVGIGTTTPTHQLNVAAGADGWTMRTQNTNGYIDFGPANSTGAHIYTDLPRFYLNKDLVLVDNPSVLTAYNNNDLRLSTQAGANPRLTVQASTGNVGIGTTNPQSQLHVTNPVGESLVSVLSTTNELSGILLGSHSLGTRAKAGIFFDRDGTSWDRGDIVFATNNSADGSIAGLSDARMTITRTGNVGIGTDAPQSRLHVAGYSARLHLQATDAGGPRPNILLQGNSGDYFYLHHNDDGWPKRLSFSFNSTSAATDPGLHLTSAGRLGIGTRNPSRDLHIAGNLRVNDLSDCQYIATDGSGNVDCGSPPMITGSGVATRVAFWTGTNALGSNSNLYWDNSNNRLGIGTSSPSQALDVNGRIRLVSSQTELYQESNRLRVRSQDTDNVAQFASYGLYLPQTGQTAGLYVESPIEARSGIRMGASASGGTITSSSNRINVNTGLTQLSGNLGVNGYADFGSNTRQMINLWGGGPDASYGIGVQSGTQYFRAGNNFAWFRGGTHSNATFDSGGGATMMVLNSSGSLGIGTTSPSRRLDVNGNLRVRGLGSCSYLNTDGSGNVDCGPGSIVTGSGTVNYVPKWTPDANSLGNSQIFDNGTHIGIGTTSPGTLLDVRGEISLPLANAYSGSNGLVIGNNHKISELNNTMTLYANRSSGDALQVRSHSNGASFRTDLVIDSNGQLGVGTAPATQLHVAGNGLFQAPSQGIDTRLSISTANHTTPSDAYLVMANSESGTTCQPRVEFVTTGRGQLDIRQRNIDSGTGCGGADAVNRLTLRSNGYFGIGTTSPSEKLEVVGNIRASGDLYLNEDSPTIYLQDNDHRSGMIHQNSNLMYFLSGSATNSTSWSRNGSYWPLTINMTNDTLTFGGEAHFMEGNVGIGTNIPSRTLDIAGNLRIRGETSCGKLYTDGSGNVLCGADQQGVTGSGAATRVAFWTGTTSLGSNSNLYWDNSNSRLGIGTANPDERLHINGSVRGNQAGALRINTGQGYVDVGPRNSSWSHFQTDRPNFYFNTGLHVSGGEIGSYNTANLRLHTGGTERIRVNASNGWVGIGTPSPSERLQVNGNLQVSSGFLGVGGHGSAYMHLSHSNYKGAGQYALLQHGTSGNTYLNSVGSGNLYFRNNNSDLMYVGSNGRVGVGTTSPAAKLHVSGAASTTLRVDTPTNGSPAMQLGRASGQPSIKSLDTWFIADGGSSNGNAGLNYWSSGDVILANGGGDVGIGTTTPNAKLTVQGSIVSQNASTGTYGAGELQLRTTSANRYWTMMYRGSQDSSGHHSLSFYHYNNGSWQARTRFMANGNLHISGVYYCNGADIAEMVGADTTGYGRYLESGDVTIIHPDIDETVGFTTKPYDSRVAGVISSAPGIILGSNGEEADVEIEQEVDVNNGAPLALVGRVPVKVTNENGPVRRGDLMVTSSTPGYAMRGDPDKIEVGMVLGKAMQELPEGDDEGMIIVLVNLQ